MLLSRWCLMYNGTHVIFIVLNLPHTSKMDQARRYIEASLSNLDRVEIPLDEIENIPQDLPEKLPPTVQRTRINQLAWRMIRKLLIDNRLSIEDDVFFNVDNFSHYDRLSELIMYMRDIVTNSAFCPGYSYLYFNSHRLFCSLAWRHSRDRHETSAEYEISLPAGDDQSEIAKTHWPILPVFHIMEPDWPRNLFERTNKAIVKGLQNAACSNIEFEYLWKSFFGSIRSKADHAESQLQFSSKNSQYEFHSCVMTPFCDLIRLIGVGVDESYGGYYQVPPGVDDKDITTPFDIDFPICYNGSLTLPVKIKKMPLKAFSNDDGTLNLADERLLGVIEEGYRSMEMTGCEYGMITDFDVVIVLKIDFDTQEWSDYINSDEGKENQTRFENLKNDIASYNSSGITTNTLSIDPYWSAMIKKYDDLKARVPISISVSKIVDTGYGSLLGRFTALSLREANFDITGEEQDRPRSRDDKEKLRTSLQKRTKLPSSFKRKMSFVNVLKAMKIFTASNRRLGMKKAIHISEGVYQKLDGFKVLQAANFQNQVYLFTFAAYAKMFPDAREKLHWLKDDDKVVLKVFNTSDADYRMRLLKSENVIEDWDTTLEEFFTYIAETYFRELKAYESIWNYNKRHPNNQLSVPKLYDYGYMSMCKENQDMIDGYDFLFSGLFILTSYIESQPNSITQDSIDICSEELRIMSKEIRVEPSDVSEWNLIVNGGKIYLIGFSHSHYYTPSSSLKFYQTELKKIGAKLLKKKERHSNASPPNSAGSDSS